MRNFKTRLQEIEGQPYTAAEFIDDYRLLACLDSTPNTPPSIVLIDTENSSEGGPLRTTFQLPACFDEFGHPPLVLERGAHKPSPAESTAPFHQDSTQRIAALVFPSFGCLVFRIEALLKFLEGRQSSEIGWDEWKRYVVIPSLKQTYSMDDNLWVSGCRLFSFGQSYYVYTSEVRAYDFSVCGRAGYLTERVNEDLGRFKHLSPTGATGERLARYCGEPSTTHSGQDGFVFSRVSVTAFRPFRKRV